MSQAQSTSTSGPVIFGDSGNTTSNAFPIVAVIVAALLVAFIVFRKTK